MYVKEIAKNIYSVGVKDWSIKDFHGYATPYGTSYNAFLITGEKNILIDTVKKPYAEKLLNNISQVIDPSKIDFLISNHTEMDHSGSIPFVMKAIGIKKPIYCSTMGAKNLSLHFKEDFDYQILKDGAELEIGSNRTLKFFETRMLHWPDSMFTYLLEEKILFSSDAFGQHYASFKTFTDEENSHIFMHAKKYYANILLHLSPLVLNLVKKIKEAKLEFNMVCPDHGLLWRNDIDKIIGKYIDWASQKSTDKVLVVFDSMWESTYKMAEAIALGISNKNVEVKFLNLSKANRSDIITEMVDAKALVLGSPTMNNGIYPTIGDLIHYIKGLKPKNKFIASFGSYGWSGEAPKIILKEFEEMDFKKIDEPLRIQYVPKEDSIAKCVKYGEKIADAIK